MVTECESWRPPFNLPTGQPHSASAHLVSGLSTGRFGLRRQQTDGDAALDA